MNAMGARIYIRTLHASAVDAATGLGSSQLHGVRYSMRLLKAGLLAFQTFSSPRCAMLSVHVRVHPCSDLLRHDTFLVCAGVA